MLAKEEVQPLQVIMVTSTPPPSAELSDVSCPLRQLSSDKSAEGAVAVAER